MKNNFVSLLVAVVALLLTSGCVMIDKSSSGAKIPGPYGDTIVTNKVNKVGIGPVSFANNGGSIVSAGVLIGGGPVPMGGQYGYGVGGYHSGGTYVQGLAGPQPINGWPAITVPIESQRYFQEQTWRTYGFGGGSGPHHPPVQSGGGRYGY